MRKIQTSTCWNPPLSCFLCGMVGEFYCNNWRFIICRQFAANPWQTSWGVNSDEWGVEGQPDEEKGGVPSQERRHAHCGPAAHRHHHLRVKNPMSCVQIFSVQFSLAQALPDLRVITHLASNQESLLLQCNAQSEKVFILFELNCLKMKIQGLLSWSLQNYFSKIGEGAKLKTSTAHKYSFIITVCSNCEFYQSDQYSLSMSSQTFEQSLTKNRFILVQIFSHHPGYTHSSIHPCPPINSRSFPFFGDFSPF